MQAMRRRIRGGWVSGFSGQAVAKGVVGVVRDGNEGKEWVQVK